MAPPRGGAQADEKDLKRTRRGLFAPRVRRTIHMPMLEVHGLVKLYGRRRVVDGVDFQVDRGEIVGLLGPNGAGKTTSFRMTCGMIEPNAGKVILNDVDV